MSEQMEKLVKEIARRLIHQFGLVQGSITAYNLAKRFITIIGKAYADGMELPREVGRYVWPTPGLKEEWIKSLYDKGFRGEDILIALRKEEEK